MNLSDVTYEKRLKTCGRLNHTLTPCLPLTFTYTLIEQLQRIGNPTKMVLNTTQTQRIDTAAAEKILTPPQHCCEAFCNTAVTLLQHYFHPKT
jgi:hypothetical protein